MDLIVVQSDLGFLEQLLMRSRFDAARDFMISSLAAWHAAWYAIEVVWFGVRSFPAPLKPAPAFLSFNSSGESPERLPVLHEGSKIVQNRCYCIFHLLFKTIYSGIGVREVRRCRNVLLKRGKVNVFQVSILIRSTRTYWRLVLRFASRRE